MLFKANVPASEVYNTALERHLARDLGVRFAERPNPDARKRPVREIVGVDPDLNHRFSKRRVSVEARRKVLAAEFQASHGRPPTPIETQQLAQRATLETREAKHEPSSLRRASTLTRRLENRWFKPGSTPMISRTGRLRRPVRSLGLGRSANRTPRAATRCRSRAVL